MEFLPDWQSHINVASFKGCMNSWVWDSSACSVKWGKQGII